LVRWDSDVLAVAACHTGSRDGRFAREVNHFRSSTDRGRRSPIVIDVVTRPHDRLGARTGPQAGRRTQEAHTFRERKLAFSLKRIVDKVMAAACKASHMRHCARVGHALRCIGSAGARHTATSSAVRSWREPGGFWGVIRVGGRGVYGKGVVRASESAHALTRARRPVRPARVPEGAVAAHVDPGV
jgi:hypothetical protein